MEDRNIDWELEEGIPQVEDPFIQQYLKGRDALIAEEQKRRHGKFGQYFTYEKRPGVLNPFIQMPPSAGPCRL